MALATSNDLSNRLRRDVDVVAAEALLEEATSLIQSFTGQTIEETVGDVVTLTGNWTRKLVLPRWPVNDVTTVVLDGTTLVADTGYTWTRQGVLWRPSSAPNVGSFNEWTGQAFWGGPDVEVVVTYDHGFNTIPAWVRGLCLDIAARAYVSPDGVVREQIDGYSVTYSQTGFNQAGGVNLTSSEEKKLRRLCKVAP